jgi:hypothetical protein
MRSYLPTSVRNLPLFSDLLSSIRLSRLPQSDAVGGDEDATAGSFATCLVRR